MNYHALFFILLSIFFSTVFVVLVYYDHEKLGESILQYEYCVDKGLDEYYEWSFNGVSCCRDKAYYDAVNNKMAVISYCLEVE